ncbi:hypothetical protein LINPERHAP1_LOCUS5949 [Linum perenne]
MEDPPRTQKSYGLYFRKGLHFPNNLFLEANKGLSTSWI